MASTSWWLSFQVTFQRRSWSERARQRRPRWRTRSMRLGIQVEDEAIEVIKISFHLNSQLASAMVSILSNFLYTQKNVETSNKIQSTNIHTEEFVPAFDLRISSKALYICLRLHESNNALKKFWVFIHRLLINSTQSQISTVKTSTHWSSNALRIRSAMKSSWTSWCLWTSLLSVGTQELYKNLQQKPRGNYQTIESTNWNRRRFQGPRPMQAWQRCGMIVWQTRKRDQGRTRQIRWARKNIESSVKRRSFDYYGLKKEGQSHSSYLAWKPKNRKPISEFEIKAEYLLFFIKR